MSDLQPRKIGEGSLQAAWRKGAQEIATALNTGQAQIVQETGDFWNPPHAQIHQETGWSRQEAYGRSLKEESAPAMEGLYGQAREQEADKDQELEPEM